MSKFLSLSVSVVGLCLSLSASAVQYQCEEEALSTVLAHLETKKEEFFKKNGVLFFCKSKSAPHKELFQWGNGSSLVGVEYVIKNGQCMIAEAPYTGQDDGDLDVEWAREYCQDFEG